MQIRQVLTDKAQRKKLLMIAITVLLMYSIPTLLGPKRQYYTLVATILLMYAALTTAWNIPCGWGGQTDLAGSTYFGVSAYVSTTIYMRWEITPWVGMFLGALTSAALTMVLAYPAFRFGLRAVWYTLASSATVQVFQTAFLMWEDIGGPVERWIPTYATKYSYLYTLRMWRYDIYYYIMAAFLLSFLFISYSIRHSTLGYRLLAIRENEAAAEALGVDVRRNKLYGVMVYAFLVGLVGTVHAFIYGFTSPFQQFTPALSGEMVMLSNIGGVGTLLGPVSGSILLVGITEYLRITFGAIWVGVAVHLLIYGTVMMVIVLLRPGGVIFMFERAARAIGRAVGLIEE